MSKHCELLSLSFILSKSKKYSLMCRMGKKSVFGFNHISKEWPPDRLRLLYNLYHRYHRQMWYYKKAHQAFKKRDLGIEFNIGGHHHWRFGWHCCLPTSCSHRSLWYCPRCDHKEEKLYPQNRDNAICLNKL